MNYVIVYGPLQMYFRAWNNTWFELAFDKYSAATFGDKETALAMEDRLLNLGEKLPLILTGK